MSFNRCQSNRPVSRMKRRVNLTIDLLAILQKRLDRSSFLYILIRDIRSSGVRASISIVQIRKLDKNVAKYRSILILVRIAKRSISLSTSQERSLSPYSNKGVRCGFKTYLVRRRTKTQKYKGALFEHLDTKQENRKQDNKTRHRDRNKVNE